MKVLLLAAGYATRLYPLTENMPKSLLPLGKKLIIDYIIESIDELDEVTEIILISNSKFANQFTDWANSHKEERESSSKAPISILNDGTNSPDNMRGAIGDILFAMGEKEINEDICIMAGDNIFTYKLSDMYDFYKKCGADTLVAIHVPEKHQLQRLAVAVLSEEEGKEGLVLDMEEKPEEPKSNWGIYATYFYKKETLPLFTEYINEGNSPDAPGRFPAWLYKRQPVYAFKANGNCIDIGTLDNYEAICKDFENKDA